MEFVALDGYFTELLSGDLAPRHIGFAVQPRVHFQTLSGGGRTNEIHDRLVGLQRHSLPVARDVTEETMLDLVPLARPGRVMARFENHPGLVGELL